MTSKRASGYSRGLSETKFTVNKGAIVPLLQSNFPSISFKRLKIKKKHLVTIRPHTI